jgi:hypothetical protein
VGSGPTTIAFYLPQFHPIPENDGWYGEGFTEWRNVVQAKPLFEGHYQPHIPKDFGFYDLRVPEVRESQARAALDHGIDAFCYYHYWFEGHRPLKRVIDEVLEYGSPNIPFCLAWANENWSRHWDASGHEVLLRQNYSREDDEEHGQFLLKAMSHPLYLRVDGRPVLFIYRIQAMPDPAATLRRWRELWAAGGIDDVHIVKFETHGDHKDPAQYGANAAAQFLPHGTIELVPKLTIPAADPGNQIYKYDDVVRAYLAADQPDWQRYECVVPMWDNAPRRGDGKTLLLYGSTPEKYQDWLSKVHDRTPDNGMVLINAWNEWAEGAHLEPDLRHGRAYLAATARALKATVPESQATVTAPLAATPFAVRDRFGELYLDALETQTRLQRRLSRMEATFERQLEEATSQARTEADEMRGRAVTLSREIDRLQGELNRLADGSEAGHQAERA